MMGDERTGMRPVRFCFLASNIPASTGKKKAENTPSRAWARYISGGGGGLMVQPQEFLLAGIFTRRPDLATVSQSGRIGRAHSFTTARCSLRYLYVIDLEMLWMTWKRDNMAMEMIRWGLERSWSSSFREKA